jgi:hypothetical protein
LSYNKTDSGAYIFRPLKGQPDPVVSPIQTFRVLRDSKVQEITQRVSNFVNMTYRIYSSSNFLEIDYSVGPLTPDRELISRFQTDLNTRGLFNTDSNVLQ